jgi:heterodisulfide reductase subunit C
MAAIQNNIKASVENGLYFCTTCKNCYENCPLEINLPDIIRKFREISVKNEITTEINKKMIENIRKFGNPFGEVKEGEIPKELYCC